MQSEEITTILGTDDTQSAMSPRNTARQEPAASVRGVSSISDQALPRRAFANSAADFALNDAIGKYCLLDCMPPGESFWKSVS